MPELSPKTFRQLFPDLSESEAAQAEANFEAYLALIIRIYDRISSDPAALAELRAALELKRRAMQEAAGFDNPPNVS